MFTRALPFLLLLPLPAIAQWSYDPAQAAATAYCAARSAGRTHKQAEGAARNAVVNATGGSFSDQVGAVLFGGRQVMQSAGYLAQKMCPELYGESLVPPAQIRQDSMSPEKASRLGGEAFNPESPPLSQYSGGSEGLARKAGESFCRDNPTLKQCGAYQLNQ